MSATGTSSDLEVSVVIATRDRPDRLERALRALREQRVGSATYEIVVVDDGSGPDTARLLDEAQGWQAGPSLTVLRRENAGGPGAARNFGWRAARAPLVAFTDDDCEPTPTWLAALLRHSRESPGAIVQGPIAPNPADGDPMAGFAHTLQGTRLGPWFETANILYPRTVLERLDGFDERTFSRPGGEDTDLAWRAITSGVRTAWAPDAVVHHAVAQLGWRGLLRKAWRWDETILCFKRYPSLRRELYWRVFWTRQHVLLFLALAAMLPGLPRIFRAALLVPYLRRLYGGRRTPTLAPFRLALDLVETAACVRGSLRYRVLVL